MRRVQTVVVARISEYLVAVMACNVCTTLYNDAMYSVVSRQKEDWRDDSVCVCVGVCSTRFVRPIYAVDVWQEYLL